MAGHSKWANIQHRKGRQDAQRAKIFTKLIREITTAARLGSPEPNANPRIDGLSISLPDMVADLPIGETPQVTIPRAEASLLKAAALGWRQEQVARNAEEIQLIGRDLYDRLRTMVAHLEAVGRNIAWKIGALPSLHGDRAMLRVASVTMSEVILRTPTVAPFTSPSLRSLGAGEPPTRGSSTRA